MHYRHRLLEKSVLAAARGFAATILTGPRRSGKTTLLKKLFPDAAYYLIEDPDIIARIRSDPHGFLADVRPPVILDEIQNVPEILNYIRSHIDARPERKGQWFITGSQELPLMKGVSESMTGRAAIFQLLPLSEEETPEVSILHGGFPEILERPSLAQVWFRSYIQTYLERDVRAMAAVHDLSNFRRFLSLLASRCGQLLNRTDMAAPLGISVPTLSAWLNILEATHQLILVPPYFENFGKRIIKSPKIYFTDTGLLCHLLGIENTAALKRSPFFGAVFESFVVSEIVKHQLHSGKAKQIYHFRDQQGLEVDFIVPSGDRRLTLLEAKASQTTAPKMAGPIVKLRKNLGGRKVSAYVVHLPVGHRAAQTVLVPDVKAVSLKSLLPTL